jgi:hypothetical protein
MRRAKRLATMLAALCAVMAFAAPAFAADFVDVPFAKLIQPAFIADYSNQRVRFEAVFMGTFPAQSPDLPEEYSEDYVRIMLCSGGNPVSLGGYQGVDCQNIYSYVVVPKSKSDPIFEMKNGQKIRVVALAQPMSTLFRISGFQSNQLLLVVDSLEIWKN